MSPDKNNEHNLDALLKQVLKDDLPTEPELRMRERLSTFRRTVESCGSRRAASRSRSWGFRPVFEQWLSQPLLNRRKLLAYVSAVTLAAGVVIHLGGYQSVLADSISLFRTSILLTGQMRLANAMECVITMPAAGAQAMTCHIRWVRDGRTRLDVVSPRGIEETLWISQGHVMVANIAPGSPGSAARVAMGIPEAARAFLSPADLARRLEEGWQVQPGQKQKSFDTLVFVDRQDGSVIEIHFDRGSFLPISADRKPSNTSGSGGVAAKAEFSWNLRVDPELMIPRREPGKEK